MKRMKLIEFLFYDVFEAYLSASIPLRGPCSEVVIVARLPQS
jgi:hypothetical protein